MGLIKDKIEEAVIKQSVSKAIKNPKDNLSNLLDTIEKYDKNKILNKQYCYLKKALNNPNGNLYKFIIRILNDIDENILEKLICNFIINIVTKGIPKTNEIEQKEGCNVPYAIAIDLVSLSNEKTLSLEYETIAKIVSEGKELGCYLYLLTGDEPLAKKDEILKLCKANNDCIFVVFTDLKLMDEEFAKKSKKIENLLFSVSIEETEESTDIKDGKGTYKKSIEAMEILKKEKILFGFSTCVTSHNEEYVISENYINNMINLGCKYGLYYNYLPVGTDSSVDLIVEPIQREAMYFRLMEYRKTKQIFLVDFLNDARFFGGCIAGGKYYLYINATGDVEPCRFIHYSNANIKNVSLLDAIKQPLFREFQVNQPFNKNLLKPCPLLDNEGKLAEMVHKTGANSTNISNLENVDSLSAKCSDFANNWDKIADELWQNDPKGIEQKQKDEKAKREEFIKQ